MTLARRLLYVVIFSCVCLLPLVTFSRPEHSDTISLLSPIYEQFPQIVGQGHQSWTVTEHKYLRNVWSAFMHEQHKTWALSNDEWHSIRGKAWSTNHTSYELSINGQIFRPDHEVINADLLARIEKSIDSSLDYGPSLIDVFVSNAHASRLSEQLAYKVLFTIAALKSCGDKCLSNTTAAVTNK